MKPTAHLTRCTLALATAAAATLVLIPAVGHAADTLAAAGTTGANCGSLGTFTSDSPINVTTTTLTSDAVWKDFGTPYVLSSALTVNAELTLDAGVTFKMPASGNIYVDNNGALITNGTDMPTKPI